MFFKESLSKLLNDSSSGESLFSPSIFTKDKTSQVILIDVSWQLYRSFYTYKGFYLTNTQAQNNLSKCVLKDSCIKDFPLQSFFNEDLLIPTGHIFGLLSSIEYFLKWDRTATIILLIDGYPKSRIEQAKQVNQFYKSNRSNSSAKLIHNAEFLVTYLASLHPNVYYSFLEDQEADDLASALSKQIPNNVLLFSGDNDWLQFLTKDNRVALTRHFSTNQPCIIQFNDLSTEESLLKKFHGVLPDKLPLFRAIVGDTSDNIKGIPRFNRKELLNILKYASNIDNLFHLPLSSNSYNKLLQNEQLVRSNYSLMVPTLSDAPIFKIIDPKIDYLNLFSLNSFKRFLQQGGTL